MADQSPNPEGGDSGLRSAEDRPPGTPLWVKTSGVIGIILVGLAVTLAIVGVRGGGSHGPGLHAPEADSGTPDGGSGSHSEGNQRPIDGVPELTITAGALAFDPDRIELTADEPVNVALTAVDTLHDLVVDDTDFHLTADSEQTVIGGLMFDQPGAYVGYCSVEGHREAGMELELVVISSDEGDAHDPSKFGH